MAKSETVVLCMPAQMGQLDGAVTDVVLKPGLKVAALLGGKPSDGVVYDGKDGYVDGQSVSGVNMFINAFNALFVDTTGARKENAPHVRVRSRDVERDVVVDGVTVRANVPEHTAYLVDG